jgi:hypothetical protein
VPGLPLEIGDIAGGAQGLTLFVLDKLMDPTFNSALGPQSALQVTPAIFQSVEQEGRWKPGGLVNRTGDVNSKGRVFELTDHAQDMNKKPVERKLQEPYGPVVEHTAHLFTLDVPGVSSTALALAILRVLGPSVPAGVAAALVPAQEIGVRCTLTIDATWWSDGLEIFAGWAGMANATGFASIFNTTANVALQAIPFGNYYPASVLVTWSGWVNPIGPAYWDFRGGMVLNADGTNSVSGNMLATMPGVTQQSWQQASDETPAFMKYWSRGKQQPQDVTDWTKDKGFVLQMRGIPSMPRSTPPSTPPSTPGASAQAASALEALLNIVRGAGPITPFLGGP